MGPVTVCLCDNTMLAPTHASSVLHCTPLDVPDRADLACFDAQQAHENRACTLIDSYGRASTSVRAQEEADARLKHVTTCMLTQRTHAQPLLSRIQQPSDMRAHLARMHLAMHSM
eukprot:6182344-Pleurochrysis_carterae.AAC.4